MATQSLDQEWVKILCLLSITFQLLRLAIDLVQVASQKASFGVVEKKDDKNSEQKETSTKQISGYGSVGSSADAQDHGRNGAALNTDEEQQPLISGARSDVTPAFQTLRFFLATWILLFSFNTAAYFSHLSKAIPSVAIETFAAYLFLEIYLSLRDRDAKRYNVVARVLHVSGALLLACIYASLILSNYPSWLDRLQLLTAFLHLVAVLLQGTFVRRYYSTLEEGTQQQGRKAGLSAHSIAILLKPYVWPDATDSAAWKNRVRAITTWICVIGSKACNLVSPLMLGWATTALAHQDFASTIQYSVLYCVISWMGSTLKEAQSVVYLKVAQAAFVQLAETAFSHLHELSLDWHLRKKLGEVLRSMDRGIAACDTLMTYLFLWLIPAIAECLIVCVIFASYFDYLPLAVTVFYFVFVYIVWTVLVTVWRKQFRKALVQSDNEWHDRFTDSMINFETVKFFTAEQYERHRFAEAVQKYQKGSVHVQASLSLLNVSQQVILRACLAIALSLAATGIKSRMDCCVSTAGCDSGLSDCCSNVGHDVCPGLVIGDFVAVLTYTLNLFAPLNFLGSVYNAVVMAVVDLTNMSELLAENPDVTDAPDAIELPRTNAANPEVAVEFQDVVFHYPTQPRTKGLKGLSFKMKRGTTTAIVGPTGAGKTTIGRLFFRFYDVLGGAVKVNGVDVRAVTQQSLRSTIGVVPQTASLFNETIRSNLRYGNQLATQEDLEQAARDAQLLDFIESLDEGWETLVGDRGLKLSGGEKQRAAIARCLLKNPPFVLLDEATSALDTLTESSVQQALDRLGKDRTVLVIAHRLGTIRNADNIIVLKDGVAAEEGTHEELLAKNGIYADMWNMQLSSTSTSASRNSLSNLT